MWRSQASRSAGPIGNGGVAHPQARVATLVVVGPRAAPVLGQEEAQAVTGAGQVVGLGVDREEARVAGDAGVEPVDEGDEEGHPAGCLVDGHRLADRLGALVEDVQAAARLGRPGGLVAQRDRCQDLPSVWVDGA